MFKNKIHLIMPAGGEGSRISSLTNGLIHKSCLKIKDKTLLERSIKTWTNNKQYKLSSIILLLRENYGSIIEELNKPCYNNIKNIITPSIELEPLGKGGALINALKNFYIEDEDIFIIHNPDDIILNVNTENIIQNHIEKELGISIIGVKHTFSPYTGVNIQAGEILDIIPNFNIAYPVHIGISIISGFVIKNHIKKNGTSQKFDFENVWFKEYLKTKQVGFYSIELENWFPVNDLKGFKKLNDTLSNQKGI